jgi:transcriptional regulator with XRE-family HTH domain
VASPVQPAKSAFGARLRDLRKDANLSGRALAHAAGMHFTKVSRLEHSRQNPSEDDIRAWCRACGAENETPDLIATLRGIEGMYQEWRRYVHTGLRVLQESVIPLYERTRLVRNYEHTVFPGLFHTADYAAVLLAAWVDFMGIPDDVDEAVAVRVQRQRVLYSGDRRFVFLLAEQVLRTTVGTSETMLGQLDRLLGVMSLPRVSVGIVPVMAKRANWAQVPFWIFDNSLVQVETVSAGLDITQPREIAMYARMFDQIRESAVHGAEARELVASAIDDFAQQAETS